MDRKSNIGWIGVGKMGLPMTRNLLKAGFPLAAYDIDKKPLQEISKDGAQIADSVRALAQQAAVIVSMVPDDRALESVAMGAEGLLQHAKAGTTYIDMSTVSPALSARIGAEAQKKEILHLRAPVSGSTESAGAGTLTILVSGPGEAFEQCGDIFKVLGQKVFHVGTADEARYLKLLVNMMVGITSAMTAEALIFGKKGGLDWNQMIDIINNSVVASPLVGFKVQLLKEKRFPAAFSVSQMSKDFDLALDTGRTLDIPLPITSLTRQLFGAMKATGRGNMDYFGLVSLLEEIAGMKKE
jgi:3-hydroxyisobutyrate dehydrogenase-like beta-hydroxyacid dehydrogenase